MHRRSIATAAAVALSLACASRDAGEWGDASMTTTVRSAISGGQKIPVALLWLHVWGTSAKGQAYDQWFKAAGTSGQFVITVPKVPVGSYLAHGKAFSSATAQRTDVADFESVGDVGFVVSAGATTPVSLTLQQNTTRWPPDRADDQAPVVDSLVASTSAVDSSPSATPVALRATASDPDGPGDLSAYAWTASYAPPLAAGQAAGVFSAPAALQTTWTPPPGYEGTVTITFTVTDLKLVRSSVSVALAVSARFGSGGATFTVVVNSSPDLLSLTTSDGQLAPGERTTLSAVASDPDGDDLRYAWDDGACDGTFGSPAAATTTYTAGAIEAACPLTVTVTDFATAPPFAARGATTTSTLVVTVARAPAFYAPEFVFAAWSGAVGVPVAPGTPLSFVVDAVQVQGTPPAPVPVTDFAWSEPGGGTFTPVDGIHPSSVTWTAPACSGRAAPFVVDVTVTAIGSPSLGALSTPLTFPVTVACP